MIQSQASNAVYLDYARQSMDEQVDYYGKVTSRADVVKDKERYVARWPVRSYQMRSDTVRTSCVDSSSTCRVSGLLDYNLSNPASGKKSSGSATFEFGIRFDASGSGRITYENSKTLSAPR